MAIETVDAEPWAFDAVDARLWAELRDAAESGSIFLLVVVPQALVFSGVGYVMWGPRSAPPYEYVPVTTAGLPEIRVADLELVTDDVNEDCSSPSTEGLSGTVAAIEAHALFADEAFWTNAPPLHAAFRLAVRGLAELPEAREGRAAWEAYRRGGRLVLNDSGPEGTGSQNEAFRQLALRLPTAGRRIEPCANTTTGAATPGATAAATSSVAYTDMDRRAKT